MEKLNILINKTYLSRSKLERDEEERRAVVRDETNKLSDKNKCEEARNDGYAEKAINFCNSLPSALPIQSRKLLKGLRLGIIGNASGRPYSPRDPPLATRHGSLTDCTDTRE
jgi:hypothetical protein